MAVEMISWPISTKECSRTGGSNPQPPENQSNAHPTELPGPAQERWCFLPFKNDNTVLLSWQIPYLLLFLLSPTSTGICVYWQNCKSWEQNSTWKNFGSLATHKVTREDWLDCAYWSESYLWGATSFCRNCCVPSHYYMSQWRLGAQIILLFLSWTGSYIFNYFLIYLKSSYKYESEQTSFSANSVGWNLINSVCKAWAFCRPRLEMIDIAVESRTASLVWWTEIGQWNR